MDRSKALLAEYTEVNSNFRLLTDIRFKLLAFLPLLAAAGLAAAGVGHDGGSHLGLEAGVFLFGLVVTGALATYNARNDQIYLHLVTRAAEIERELGLPDGSFSRRPNAWLEISLGFRPWHIGHVTSVSAMYAAAIMLWLTGFLVAVTHLAWGSGEMPWWTYAAAIAIALTVVPAGIGAIRRRREAREEAILEKAAAAIEIAPELRAVRSAEECEALHNYKEFVEVCIELFGGGNSRDWSRDEIHRRIRFYAELSDAERHRHGLDESGREDVNYVASIVDLSPGILTGAPRRR